VGLVKVRNIACCHKYFNVKAKCDSRPIKEIIVVLVSESSAGCLISEVKYFMSDVLDLYTEISEAGNSCE
jgi:hypothetical protein